MSDNVKVICRVRPFNEREKELAHKANEGLPEWDQRPIRSVVEMTPSVTIFLDGDKEYKERERFNFDENIWSIPDEQQKSNTPFSSQEDVYVKIGAPALKQCWDGFNTCIFAYGQTGAGKTFTMMGSHADPGLIPRLCQNLFTMAQERALQDTVDLEDKVTEYTIEARFLEIYNEHVKDLLFELAPKEEQGMYDRENLKVRNFPGKGPEVVGLTAVKVSDWSHMVDIIRVGTSNRTEAATKMNDNSSRSHGVFKITFTQATKLMPKKQFEKMQVLERFANINLVDLAGSERLKKSGAEGIHLKEAAAINKSLTTLKQVIDALVEGKSRATIPYRESQLTWLLSENLGGNSKTFMIACISPHQDNAEETLNTCRYALRAQGISCHATVNDSDDMKKLQRINEEMTKIQSKIDQGGGYELQQELAETREAFLSAQARLADVDNEAKQLQHALQQQKEAKYAQAFHSGFRVLKEKKDREKLEKESAVLQRQLSRIKKSKYEAVGDVERAEMQKRALDEEEEDAVENVRRRQGEISFWKNQSKELEHIQNELLLSEEVLRVALDRKEGEKKLTAMVGALNSARLKTTLEQQLKDFEDRHLKSVDTLKSEALRNYEEYSNRALERFGEAATTVDSLKQELEDANEEYNAAKISRRHHMVQLEKELVFLEQEKLRNQQDYHAQLKMLVEGWSQKYDRQKSALQEDLTKKLGEWSNALERALYEQRNRLDKKRVDWESELEDARRKGEDHLTEISRNWSIYFEEGCEGLREEVRLRVQNNTEMKDALQQYDAQEVRFQKLSDAIEAKVQATLSSKSGSYELQHLVNKLLSQTSEYKSIVPEKYSLAPPSYSQAQQRKTAECQPFVRARSRSPMNLTYTPRAVHAVTPGVTWNPRSSSPLMRSQTITTVPLSKAPSRTPSPNGVVIPTLPIGNRRSISPLIVRPSH